MALLSTFFASVVTVFGRIRISQRWVWRVLFFVFTTLFFLLLFILNWFTGTAILRRIRFVQWRVRRCWVWIRFPWYARSSILLWKFCWSFKWRRLWHICSDWNRVNMWHYSVGRVRTKRSWVQRWSTCIIILAPKILILPLSFKISFSNLVLLWPFPTHFIRWNFTNMMAGREPVGAICWSSNSGSGDKDRPKFIWCVDRQDSQIYKF